MFFDVLQYIINFTWGAFNEQITLGNGISFSLWDIIVYSVVAFLIFFFIFKVLLFFDNHVEVQIMYILAAFMRNANYLVLLFIFENILLVFLIISQLFDHLSYKYKKSLFDKAIDRLYLHMEALEKYARRRESDN